MGGLDRKIDRKILIDYRSKGNDYIFFLKVESNHTGLLNPEAEAK